MSFVRGGAITEVVEVTTTQMWHATAAALLLYAVLAGMLWRLLPRHALDGLSWPFAATAAVVWALIYGLASLLAWDSCYQFVLPSWVRWVAWPYGLAHGALAYAFWWIARRAGSHPVVVLTVLGGLHSLPGHLNGIYSRGLLEACPIVRGVTPAAALTFGFFEFAFYWMWVLMIALGVRTAVERMKRGQDKGDIGAAV